MHGMGRCITATLLVALMCVSALSASAAVPSSPSDGVATVDADKVNISWSPTFASSVIVQSGCTASNLSMAPIAKAFMTDHPSIEIELTGGTNTFAFTEWTEGRSDIAQASRAIDPVERSAAQKEGLDPVDIMVGAEAVAVLVNPDLGIESLSMEQLRGIFDGSINTWSAVGGPDVPVERVGTVQGKSAYNLIRSMVLNGAGYANMSHHDDVDVPAEVRSREGAIGFLLYGLMPTDAEDMMIEISVTEHGRPTVPEETTVYSSAYPLSRTFHLVTDGEPDGAIGSWIDFILDPGKGQAILRENGFIPLPESERMHSREKVAGTLSDDMVFHVYRSYEGNEDRFVANVTSFVDESPPMGVNVTYEVSAVVNGEESERSPPMTVFVPEKEGDASGVGSYMLPLLGIVGVASCALIILAVRKR